MAILEREMPLEEMKKRASNNKCSCGGNLAVAWGGSFGHNCYILRCCENIDHSDFTRPVKISNYDLPGYNMPGTSHKKEKELTTRIGEEKTKALVRAAGGNILSTLTEKAARSMAEILWPEAIQSRSGQNAIAKLALICRDYGLNPAMDHVFLIKFKDQWAVVRGIKASRLISARDKSYGYIDDTPRVMTEAEQTKIFGEVDKLNLCTICKLKDKDGNVFTGYGKWPLSVNPYGTEKGNSKFNMSCIRGERQALDKMNPGSMPAIDVVDENYMPMGKVIVTEEGAKVDTQTGEIKDETIEGQFVESSSEAPSVVQPPQDTTLTGEVPTSAKVEAQAEVKDETPLTNDQLVELEKLLKDANLTNAELANYAKGKDKGWKFNAWKDLHCWQYVELKNYLEKAAGK